MFFLNPCCLIILDALAGKSGVNFKDPCVCVKVVVTCSGVYGLSESFCYKFLPSNLVELFC